jgi:hypothetical protein
VVDLSVSHVGGGPAGVVEGCDCSEREFGVLGRRNDIFAMLTIIVAKVHMRNDNWSSSRDVSLTRIVTFYTSGTQNLTRHNFGISR